MANNKEVAVLEIRPGTGGTEAGLFASDLYQMYQGFAKNKAWKIDELEADYGDLGDLRKVTAKISGKDVYELLRRESGVHRVQRVPETESRGRIHTSTATVAVLPELGKRKTKLNPQDLKIETMRAHGPGGQFVNKVETAVRVTHIPTGIAVVSQDTRNQQKNKEIALGRLRKKLTSRLEKQKEEKVQKMRRGQIGEGERYERIRTYNFPQNRVTDHRIKKSWHTLEDILDGDLEPVILALQKKLKT